MIKRLYENHYRRLKGLAFTYVGTDCEDVVQDAFIRMMKHQDLPYEEAAQYINFVVLNLCRDRGRAKKRKLKAFEEMPEGRQFDEININKDLGELQGKVDGLTPTVKKYIYFKFVLGYRVTDIAKMFNVGKPCVSFMITRGLKQLKKVV